MLFLALLLLKLKMRRLSLVVSVVFGHFGRECWAALLIKVDADGAESSNPAPPPCPTPSMYFMLSSSSCSLALSQSIHPKWCPINDTTCIHCILSSFLPSAFVAPKFTGKRGKAIWLPVLSAWTPPPPYVAHFVLVVLCNHGGDICSEAYAQCFVPKGPPDVLMIKHILQTSQALIQWTVNHIMKDVFQALVPSILWIK